MFFVLSANNNWKVLNDNVLFFIDNKMVMMKLSVIKIIKFFAGFSDKLHFFNAENSSESAILAETVNNFLE